jgi:NACalpha-BTF3-like transcription factor
MQPGDVDFYLRTAANQLDGVGGAAANADGSQIDNTGGNNQNVLSLDDISHISAMRQSRLTAQVEEMAELNQAILLSLRDAEEHGRGGQAATTGFEPAESDVELLMGMGFEREASVRALKRHNGNVERAADQLLSS